MTEKRIIYINDQPIALKYNHRSNRITVGGNARLRSILETVVAEYFRRRDMPRARFTQKNKMRFVFKGTAKEFDAALRRLRQAGVSSAVVRAHYNIMR